MSQGNLEGEDSYIKQVRLAIEIIILSGGRHVLCSTDIMLSLDQAKPSYGETKSEKNKLSVINLPWMSDPVRYGILNKEL